MPPRHSPLRTSLAKLKGEYAELQFMSRALSLGLRVGRIYGDSGRYDFLVDAAGRLSRVQVKSVWRRQGGTYRISAQRGAPLGKVPYRSAEVDFVIGYVVPEDAWYVVPARALARRRSFWVYPHRPSSRGRFEKYRDAWRLLGPLPTRFDLHAAAEDLDGCPTLVPPDVGGTGWESVPSSGVAEGQGPEP